MSDPLGLLQSDDPLGLMAPSRPVSFLRAAPADKPSFLGDLWDDAATFMGLKNSPAQERAKAANIIAISDQMGIAPSIVQDHYEDLTKELEIRDQPTFKDMVERPLMGAVVYGLMAHPVATAIGVTAFGVLSEAENYIASKAESKPYQFGAGRGLADLLPEDTAQGFRDLVWTADMAVKAVAAGASIKTTKAATDQFVTKFMRDTIETYNLPRSVYISPEKIREFHGLGREDVISPEESAILKDLGLTRQQYVEGLRNGIDVEIPAEKLVTIVDKPWWGKLKELFRVSPYEETVVTRSGKPTGKPTGLLEGPGGDVPLGVADATVVLQQQVDPAIISPVTPKPGTGDIPPKKTLKPEGGIKEPWQMTINEYLSSGSEIDTSTAKYKFFPEPTKKLKRGEYQRAKLSEILEFPELYEKYPYLKDFTVKKMPREGGQFGAHSPGEITIVEEKNHAGSRFYTKEQVEKLRRDDEQVNLRSLFHEIQHEIDFNEAGYRDLTKPYATTFKEYWNHPEEVKARATERIKTTPTKEGYTGIVKQALAAGEPIPRNIIEQFKNEKWFNDEWVQEKIKSLPNPSRPPEVGGQSISAPAEKLTPLESPPINYDDVNTLLELAGKSDEATAPFVTSEYDKIRVEAARIAFDNLTKKIDIKKRLITEAEKEDFHLELLEEEAKAYRRLLKERGKPSTPGIKQVIKEQTGQLRVEELMISEYEALKAAMKKAEQASRAAFREGKIEGALAEKERQIELAMSRKERLKAKEEAKGIHRGIVEITKDKAIPEEYRDRISALLEDFDILPRSAKTAARVESAREFIERQKQAGEDVSIPESMLNRIERYGKIHWRELALDQLREIYDQAKMYQHLGKLKNKLIASKKKHDFESTVNALISNIEKNWGVRKASPEDFERMFLDPSRVEGFAEFKENYLASLTKVETYLRRLDGFKDLGPVWETVYLPIKEASDLEFRKLTEITTELQRLFDPIKKTLTKEKFKIPGVSQWMTREKVLMVALNSGNEGNLAALRDNKVYKWSDAEISAILANVTPEEWALVRGVWALFDRQFPELAKVYKNLSGTELKKVDGDYFPLVFDRKLSWIADRNATEAEMRDFFQSIYTRPAVKTGSTIERVGGKMPPRLELSVIFEKLAEINHYISHAEAVRDVQKILGDPRVRYVIEGVPTGIGGPEAYREMLSWLQDVARQKNDPLSAVEAAIKTARINTTTVAMAWKFSTAAMQLLGMANTFYKIGGEYAARGLAEFYLNREAMVEKINGMSAEMAGRAKSFDRELRDAYNRLGLEHFRKSAAIKDTFFSLISLMDMAVAYPTWLGAFNKGMRDFKDETKAVEYADMILRMSQGAALVKDLAGIQRGSELKKLLSMFYTFFSSYQQMMSDAWIKFKMDKTGANFADLMKAWWWLTIVPAVAEYAMKERDIPGPGGLVATILNQRLTAYPVVRDIMGLALTDYDYQFSPVARAGEVMAKTVNEAGKVIDPDEEVDFDRLIKYSLESAGYAFGLPTGQAVVTMQGLVDLKNGETSDLSRLLFRAPRESED